MLLEQCDDRALQQDFFDHLWNVKYEFICLCVIVASTTALLYSRVLGFDPVFSFSQLIVEVATLD